MTLELDPNTTALVLIDLQKAIVERDLSPYPASDVVARSAQLALALRAKGGTVIYVNVLPTEILRLPADRSFAGGGASPPDASEIVPEAGITSNDILVTKRSWGAFYGTDLELHLRRRGITTIILGGIATNFGVESTARAAHDHGYALVFPEDAMTSMSADAHRFTVETIFPIMGRVRSTSEILTTLK